MRFAEVCSGTSSAHVSAGVRLPRSLPAAAQPTVRPWWPGGILLALLLVLAAAAIGGDVGPTPSVASPPAAPIPQDWQFEPSWRNNGDCGPVSLYVLARLQGVSLNIFEVKKALPYDPVRGCSLADMSRASEALDFATSIQFIKPADLKTVPPPFVLHANGSLALGTGHFLVVTAYDPKRRVFSTIDTSFQRSSEFSEDGLLVIFSGYVLTPTADSDRAPYVVGITSCIILSGILMMALIAKPRPAPRLDHARGRDQGIISDDNEVVIGTG